MQNPFSNPAFSMANLTAAINLLPNRYGRLESLNLFPVKPVRFRQILIEEKNGVLNLLPTLPVGSPGTVGQRDKRKMRSFVVPHIPHDDVVLSEEVQGLRAFGSESELETVAGVMARHLETMRNKHAITLEHLRMGALKGIILDADGSTLYNLYDEFGIAPKSINFALTTDSTNVRQKCVDTGVSSACTTRRLSTCALSASASGCSAAPVAPTHAPSVEGGIARPLRSRMPEGRYSGVWSAYLAIMTCASMPAVGKPLSMICAGTGAWVRVSH